MPRWSQTLERWARPLAVPHVLLAIVAGQTFFYLVSLLGLFDETRLWFAWAKVFEGEWWRLLTFVVSPPAVHWAFFAFVIFCLYNLGEALEAEWGTLKFNLFLLTGWFLTIGLGLLAPGAVLGNIFIAGSVFLAFAYLNPNHEFQLYFILPVKAKYLAVVSLVLYTFKFATGDAPTRLEIIASLGNFFVFLGPQMLGDLRGGRRRLAYRAKQVAVEREIAAAGPRHRCVVCGKNSETHPSEDFRYRADDQCYCSEHVRQPMVAKPEPKA
jgi:hypothetical protein